MRTSYILAAASIVFFIAATTRGPRSPQGRIWLRIALIFAVVSLWLFVQGCSHV